MLSSEQIEDLNDPYFKDLSMWLDSHISKLSFPGDSATPLYSLSSSEIDELSMLQYEHVKKNYIASGTQFQTVDEARKSARITLGDSLYNETTGIGTMLDPTIYTQSEIPVMLGPYEASSVYAPGGLPATIIDKKTRTMFLQGANFRAVDKNFWTQDKLDRLIEQAEETGFNNVASDAVSESFIYGGSVLYPVFKKDTPSMYLQDMDMMILDKGCIERWVSVDRWNLCFVPNYIVTANDYLNPKTVYVPLGGVEISTSRMALVRPKPMPYWTMLYNLGWCPSDFSGWLRAYFGYETVCQSIPVMAQQMSLILYKMPLDALNATIGAQNVEKLMEINEQKMAEWSVVQPKAVNMVGEVEVVDRTYSGLEQLIGAMKSNLAAHCGLPEPSLWHTPNKGFSDNTTESLLKQSETLQMLQRNIERSMSNCCKALIAHTFGSDSEEYEHSHTVKMTFDKPVISTEKDLAESGARFAASVSSLTSSGVSPDIAIEMTQQFFPSVKLDEGIIAKVKKSYEEAKEVGMAEGQKMGSSVASTGMNNTTGKLTKAGK